MPKLVIPQTKKFNDFDPSSQELPAGYKDKQNQELSNASIMVSTSGNVTIKPYTELLKFSHSQAFPNQVRYNYIQYDQNTTNNFFYYHSSWKYYRLKNMKISFHGCRMANPFLFMTKRN